MAALPVITTSGVWRQVLAYIAERRAELVAECISLATTDQRRAECAARIAELDELQQAPEATRREAEMQQQPPIQGAY